MKLKKYIDIHLQTIDKELIKWPPIDIDDIIFLEGKQRVYIELLQMLNRELFEDVLNDN